MALIVEYHVVADMYPIGTTQVLAGHIVRLNANGQVIPQDAADATNSIGIAGDTDRTTAGRTTAYSDEVVIGADGINSDSTDGAADGDARRRWTENRVSDFYDETAASGKMTVYHGGGKFWISDDLIASGTPAPGSSCETSATTAGEWQIGGGITAGTQIGLCVGASQAYPSGVPGTDVQGSISLGDYVPIILQI